MTFGGRLRDARERAGLSQLELGGAHYSGSYISHLERDRRVAGPGVAEYLAERLKIDVSELLQPDRAVVTPEQASAALDQIQVLDAALRGDHLAAAEHVRDRDEAAAITEPSDWWTGLYLRAEALSQIGDYEQSVATTATLLSHPMAEISPGLRAAVLVTRSRALIALGRLAEGREVARDAVATAERAGQDETLGKALLAQIAAVGELGDSAEVTDVVGKLIEVRTRIASDHLRGRIAWSVGNAYFLAGNIPGAVTEHDHAAALLRPQADLRAWARFCKASAELRLSAGIEDGVEHLLEQAAAGLLLAGNPEDRAELNRVRAAYALRHDPQRALELVSEVLPEGILAAHSRAPAHVITARAYTALGDAEHAREHWVKAAECYEQAGASEKSLEIWRSLAQHETPAVDSTRSFDLDAGAGDFDGAPAA